MTTPFRASFKMHHERRDVPLAFFLANGASAVAAVEELFERVRSETIGSGYILFN